MKPTSNRIVCLALWMAGMGGSAWAQDGTVTITAGAQARDVVVSVQNGANNCGMEIRFGDGRDVKKRLEVGEVWTVNHTYAAEGSFGIRAEGVLVARGLRTVGPCSYGHQALFAAGGNNASMQTAAGAPAPAPAAGGARPAASATPADNQGAHQDMVLMVRKNASTLKLVSTIDGGKRLSNTDELVRSGSSLCIVKFPNAYGAVPDTSVDVVARAELDRYLSQFTGGKQVSLRKVQCIANHSANATFQASSDLVLVQRQALSILVNGSAEFAQGYEALHEVSHARLFALAEQMKQAEARRQQTLANRVQELDALAQANSTDKIGSIAFGVPRSAGQVALCTLSYEGDQGAAILGYAYRGLATQSDAFRSQAQSVRATVDNKRPYAKAYANIEALYEARQTKPDECLVYVDFPANLKKVSAALLRDSKASAVVNELVDTADLRDEWAKVAGYRHYAEYQTARDMKVDAQQFKQLGEYRITDKAGLDAAIRDMQASRYASGSDLGDLLNFLRDKAEAAGKPGVTAVSLRDARQKATREAAETSAAAERRRREEYAREYPFIAVLTCGMPGHINIMACFAGGSRGVDTELKLRNGDNSGMYKVYNLQQAGQERRDGFYIDLRRNFDLRAQNADGTLILGLKIIDRVTGNVLHQDQASRFDVVSARN